MSQWGPTFIFNTDKYIVKIQTDVFTPYVDDDLVEGVYCLNTSSRRADQEHLDRILVGKSVKNLINFIEGLK